MAFIQVVPPITPPPPPPGLPIDSNIIVLGFIGVIYGLLILKRKANNYHLSFIHFFY